MTTDPDWRGTGRILLHGGAIYSPAEPFASALLIEGETIAWIGSAGAALALADGVDEVIDLDGAQVTPAFVDSHVHLTATGLLDSGVDLTSARSRSDALDLIAAHVRDLERDTDADVVLGHGWDDSGWGDGRLTADDLDRVGNGRSVYLTRIDVHSAVASRRFLRDNPDLAELPGFHDDGRLLDDAHHHAHARALAALSPGQRRQAQRNARAAAARRGIGLLVEAAGPQLSGEADARDALALNATPGPLVAVLWGELGGVERARDIGAIGAAGDLYVDGALGSHTAALRDDYDDAAGRGNRYLDAQAVADHVVAAVKAGLHTGFHAIGDAAIDIVLTGYQAAVRVVGTAAMAGVVHRIEHAEMIHPEHLDMMADLGIIASVQPVFDELWGGPDGMYARRVGPGRAETMNPWASLAARGIPLAFGSDSPVTPIDPWRSVRAAVNHRTERERISARAAFSAHTRGGWRALGLGDRGALMPGARADLAIWDVGERLVVQAPDDRIQAWSTDPRSGTPGLPDMSPEAPTPRCLRTIVAGHTVHRAA